MAEYNPSKIIKDGNTYNFRDTTKIPLAGSNQISGSLIPETDNSIDIGSSTSNIKMLYTKGITIDGKTVDTDANGNITYDGHIVDTIEEQGDGYIRYSNGIQICWGTKEITWSTKEAATTISFAKSFIRNVTVSLSHLRAGYTSVSFSQIREVAESNFIAIYASTVSANPAGILYWLAIGEWK